MRSHKHPDRVVDLAAARARRHPEPDDRPARTIILQVSNVRADGEAHRQIGVTDSLRFSDVHDVLAVAFGLREPAPWSFTDTRGARLDNDAGIGDHLGRVGAEITFRWGLWDFRVTAAHSWPRDSGTPWALCVGGSGRFGDTGFDIARINAELTGHEATREILARTRPAVRGIIERSQLFDLVPLLQALDLGRDSGVDADLTARLAGLPVENDAAGTDAFWAVVLGLSCLADDEHADHVTEQIVAALGWVDDDGSALTAAAARELCAASVQVLAEVGVYGDRRVAAVDKLDIFRELLRATE